MALRAEVIFGGLDLDPLIELYSAKTVSKRSLS